MKNIIAAIVIATGLLGVEVKAQVVAPTLEVVTETQSWVRLKLTAGSEPIEGFSLYYQVPGRFYAMTQFYGTPVDPSCEVYQLNPGESVEVNIGKAQHHHQVCRADFWPKPLYCNQSYLFQAVPHNAGGPDGWSNTVEGTTAPCL